MAPDLLAAKGQSNSKKRKEAPGSGPSSKPSNDKRPRIDHRAKQREARQLVTQATSKAFKHGELDVDKFVKAREFEIRALEEGLNRSKKALNRRAFQNVPKDLRRRTASHNVKKVPKRLRARAKKEMLEDNTPTVTSRRRKPTRHMRLRLETVKKLRALGSKKRSEEDALKVKVKPLEDEGSKHSESTKPLKPSAGIKTRKPKVKKGILAQPPVPRVKFRKRQIHKSWLPTHIFHAKRAHMTPPSNPLWRFSIALSPTAKGYRPTHRAHSQRGAIAWDMSYISTISLEGREESLISALKGLHVGMSNGAFLDQFYGQKGAKWRNGLRALESFVYEREEPHNIIAPITLLWRAPSHLNTPDPSATNNSRRKLLLRVHPSAFYQLWDEVNRVAKVAKPQITVEDLRFEIGSIEVSGPGSTEALLGALWPTGMASDKTKATCSKVGETWTALAGLGTPSVLPAGAMMGLSVQDPRLHHPPRTIELPTTEADQDRLLELTASWPVDGQQQSQQIFDRRARLAASAALPSQKTINRRKALAKPGQLPEPSVKDPQIPALIFANTSPATTSSSSRRNQAHDPSSWTVLLPWKCVQPVWYSIVYYPLSTGQQPRYGGLQQKRQLAFEAGKPWFPADYPSTQAGWEWELKERRKRHDEWKRKPKSKRTSWEKLELGNGRKGEIGTGWACDWEKLLGESTQTAEDSTAKPMAPGQYPDARPVPQSTSKPAKLGHVSSLQAESLLSPSAQVSSCPTNFIYAILNVRVSVFRGVPSECARIYRLPTNAIQRKNWFSLLPSNREGNTKKAKTSNAPLPRLSKDTPTHVAQQRLAASLLAPPRASDEDYPSCPDEVDLIGFVTSGNYNLGEGKGTGIGGLMFGKLFEAIQQGTKDQGAGLCIIRNAGSEVVRLAKWEMA